MRNSSLNAAKMVKNKNLFSIIICHRFLITRRPQVQVLSPQPCLIADFVWNQRFLFTFYTVLRNEQESVYGFCSLFVLCPVRTVLHFIAGYPARSRRAGFIFALCLGWTDCAQAVRLRVLGWIPGCAVSRSCSELFVVSIGYTLTIQRKQHEKRFTRVIKIIMKRIIIEIYSIDTNAHIAYT